MKIFSHVILIAAGVLVLAALAGLLQGCVYDQRPTAEAQGREYLRTMYPHAHERLVSCMNRDTDSNGYVTCEATVDGRSIRLECAANNGCWFDCNSGCKLRRMVQIQPEPQ